MTTSRGATLRGRGQPLQELRHLAPERLDLAMDAFGGAVDAARHAPGIGGGFADAGDIGGHLRGSGRGALHVPRDLAGGGALLLDRARDRRGDLVDLAIAAAISFTASTALLVELDCADLWPISSVAFAVCAARFFTSEATTAKPLPASPARAASMVALRASRLVCAAIRDQLDDVADPPRGVRTVRIWLPARAASAARPVRCVDFATWRLISSTDDASSSAALATVATLLEAWSDALRTPEVWAAGLLGRRSHLAGIGFKIGRRTRPTARNLIQMRAEGLGQLPDLDHATAEAFSAGIDDAGRTAERAGQTTRQDLAEIFAAARIVHRRRSLAHESVGDVEHVVDRLLDRPDPPGLPLAQDAGFEIALGRLAAHIRHLIDGQRRPPLAPEGITEQQDGRAEQRRGWHSGRADQRENQREAAKTQPSAVAPCALEREHKFIVTDTLLLEQPDHRLEARVHAILGIGVPRLFRAQRLVDRLDAFDLRWIGLARLE